MKTLVVQMGHVPRKTGATGTAGEQAMAKSVAAAIVSLTPVGWLTRAINADVRSSLYKGDVFVAIHGDGSSNHSVNGASVGYRNEAGKKLATAWKAAYKKRGWTGGFHADNYTPALHGYYGVHIAVNEGTTHAFIIEVGTMTNHTDRAFIDAHHRTIAQSVWDAVAPGWDKPKPVPKPVPTPTTPYPGHVIGIGHKHTAEVKWIQRRLTAHGIKTDDDGEYGKDTAAAVHTFRLRIFTGRPQGNDVGPSTWAALAKN